jgi:hypothetical protein
MAGKCQLVARQRSGKPCRSLVCLTPCAEGGRNNPSRCVRGLAIAGMAASTWPSLFQCF